MAKTIITFDFDGTIGHLPYIQRLARDLRLDPNNSVHIVTRRYGYLHPNEGDEMSQVLNLAHQIGIKQENVHFTNRAYKVEKLRELGSNLHFDDDYQEIIYIRQNLPGCLGFLVDPKTLIK